MNTTAIVPASSGVEKSLSPNIPKVKTWKEYVLLALAAGVPSTTIARKLGDDWNIIRTPRAIRQIRNRNPEKVYAARAQLELIEPYFDKTARIKLLARRIRHLEGLADSAGKKDYVKIELAIATLAEAIGKEQGTIQTGSRQTNITNVHQGPEKDYLAFHRDRQEERRRALGGE